MAVVHVKFTFFHPLGYGWSESWYRETSDPSLLTFFTAKALPMAGLRASMLSTLCVLETISCSFDPAPKGDSVLKYVNIKGKLLVEQVGPPGGTAPDAPWTGVLLQFRGGNEQWRKAVFTRGQPDDVVEPSGRLLSGAGWPAFQAAANAYILALIGDQWGWIRNVPSDKFPLTTYEPDDEDPKYIIVTCPAGTFPLPGAIPLFIRIRINYPNVKSELNGAWVARVLSTSQVRIITPMALFAPPENGTLVIYGTAFTGATSGDIQKATRRAPGRPLLRTRGRLGNRIRG